MCLQEGFLTLNLSPFSNAQMADWKLKQSWWQFRHSRDESCFGTHLKSNICHCSPFFFLPFQFLIALIFVLIASLFSLFPTQRSVIVSLGSSEIWSWWREWKRNRKFFSFHVTSNAQAKFNWMFVDAETLSNPSCLWCSLASFASC